MFHNLLLLDLGAGRCRLGGSALAQVYGQVGADVPDLEDPARLAAFFELVQELLDAGDLLAYHDRSDGGLISCLAEMGFAGHCGIDVDIAGLGDDDLAVLFNEEAGAVLQVPAGAETRIHKRAIALGLGDCIHSLGEAKPGDELRLSRGEVEVLVASRTGLQKAWSETSYRIQALRDNPACADEEFAALDAEDPGLSVKLNYDPEEDIAAPMIATGVRPAIAVLREQGVNGHVEMAAAFQRAGFAPFDVAITEIVYQHKNDIGRIFRKTRDAEGKY